MNVIALGPLLIPLPRLYAFMAALALLLAGLVALRQPRARQARWFNGLLLAWLIGARLGHVLLHADSYLAAPQDSIKLWQPGYSTVWGMLAAAGWSAWLLRERLSTLIIAQLLLAVSVALWLMLMLWNPLGGRSGLHELPVLALENLDGERVDLRDLKGERVVLNLWATGCPPCLRGMPLLAEAAARDDVSVVIANQGESLLEVVRYLDAQHLVFDDALLDPDQRLMTLSKSPGLPASLLFDTEGRLVEHHAGELTRAQLNAWLAR